ncbi:malate dehydrogenase [candidate division KSB1 bacterium]|nr:malate dehydrogenase [candidate division KSB1 bacterium]NIR71541.1 malate dehydrogenase [candidate division KSB1 bacterium]NIS26337.1 malate dehydrogenase [candidate division KSB1 bacterium]NIT73104.1 malate dehydrogenase [candidate division KSB1 bacterium]NIU27020.1 malate dehydrogenase [candidate division KSB1 bacterium]
MLNKIALIGAGNIGGVLIQEIVRRRLARNVAVVDVKEPDLAKGKALDIAEGSPVISGDIKVEGAKQYDVIDGADMVINTAGVPRTRRPDGTIPTREELLTTNLKITDAVSGGIQRYCPKALVISIANPLDAIVFRLNMNLKPPRERLFGMAGVLDSARYRYFVAEAAGVSVENVEALVLGGHGDNMLPIRSACRIAGMPVEKFVSPEKLDAIEERTRKAGGEVVKLLGVGSAFVSPAWSALEMAEAIIFDKKKIMAASTLLQGEYGVNGLFVGVPVILGANGVEKVIEMELTDKEKSAFENSVQSVKQTADEVIAMTSK